MGGPWGQEQINAAREVKLSATLGFLGVYYKVDVAYEALASDHESGRLHFPNIGRDFRFVVTGEQFVNALVPPEEVNRSGGSSIEFARHVTGLELVPAAKVCLEALIVRKER